MADLPIAYVSRHGETALNVESALKGWLDAPLTEKGMQQAERQAEVLVHMGLTKIFCSPLLRAVQTASYTAGIVGLSPVQDRGLATWHVGIFEGVSKEDAKDAIQLFLDNPSVKMPDGESIEEFEQRIADFFSAHLAQAEKDGPYCFFTHNSTISALSNMLSGERREVVELSDVIPTGGIAAVYADGKSYRMEAIFEPTDQETPK